MLDPDRAADRAVRDLVPVHHTRQRPRSPPSFGWFWACWDTTARTVAAVLLSMAVVEFRLSVSEAEPRLADHGDLPAHTGLEAEKRSSSLVSMLLKRSSIWTSRASVPAVSRRILASPVVLLADPGGQPPSAARTTIMSLPCWCQGGGRTPSTDPRTPPMSPQMQLIAAYRSTGFRAMALRERV